MPEPAADVAMQTAGTGAAFGSRLVRAKDDLGPLCVGIDPHATELSAWNLSDDATGLREFALRMLDAAAGHAAAVKPQSAFFERHGSAGIAVLEELLGAARDLGVLVILDVKRGDIGSTAAAYADAYLRPESSLFADAVTASPYLGFGSLSPLYDAARRAGSGVFVLAYTSNPEAPQVQQARGPDGRTVTATVLAALAALNAGPGPGSFGAVVGATAGPVAEELEINGPLLAPGLGAQGATASDLPAVFGTALPWVLPSASRSLSSAGPDRSSIIRAVQAEVAALRKVVS
jgi:orotidine-5'-phosphate decarboxylase